MGADYFETTIVAKTAGEAFRQAGDRARWEDGHGGYTGTIAEKHGYAMFTIPARMTAKRFVRLVADAEWKTFDADSEREARESLRWMREVGATKAQINVRERQYARERKASERFWRTVPEHARYDVERAAELCADKWGDAICVELRGAEATAARKRSGHRGRAFLFFGYASS